MMDLDSAIQHCKEQVQEQAKKGCYSCAEEHQQLAEWLKELKAYKEQSGDAISRQMAIDVLKDIKDLQGRNIFAKKGLFPWNVIAQLPSATPQQRTGRWIPVWERLPEERGVYLVTQKAIFPGYVFRRIVGYAPNLHDVDEYDFADKKRPGWYEYDSEWGYRELNDVTAWMPLPEPYKAESEEV